MVVTYVTLGVGLLALVVLALVVLGHVRRFTRASDALRAELQAGRRAVRAAVPARWSSRP